MTLDLFLHKENKPQIMVLTKNSLNSSSLVYTNFIITNT